MNELEILAMNVKRWRAVKDLTQEDLAKKSNLAKESISQIELGKRKNPYLKNLISISQALDIKLFELFIESPDVINVKFIVGKQNLDSLERVLDKISKRMDIRFKADTEEGRENEDKAQ